MLHFNIKQDLVIFILYLNHGKSHLYQQRRRQGRTKDVILVNGDAHFAPPRTNQILIEALMRGHSARREMERQKEDTKEIERTVVFSLELSFAVFYRYVPTCIRLTFARPSETTIIIIHHRDFCNFVFPASRSLHPSRLFSSPRTKDAGNALPSVKCS